MLEQALISLFAWGLNSSITWYFYISRSRATI